MRYISLPTGIESPHLSTMYFTDDIEVIISDVKQIAQQLNDEDIAVLNLIKAYMPTDI